MFFCVVAFVLSTDNTDRCPWEAFMCDNEPKCLTQNVIQFNTSEFPGSVTMIDYFPYFEVHVKTADKECEGELWQLVYRTLFKGLEKASETLGYRNNTYEHAIICRGPPSESHPDTIHLATVSSKGWWMCSENKEIGGKMNPKATPWWRDPTAGNKNVPYTPFVWCVHTYILIHSFMYFILSP